MGEKGKKKDKKNMANQDKCYMLMEHNCDYLLSCSLHTFYIIVTSTSCNIVGNLSGKCYSDSYAV